MANKNHPLASPSARTGEPLLEIAERLIWALLDEQISAAECSQLERLILDHEQVRRRYSECIQLHLDLHSIYRRQPKPASSTPTPPVLGQLDFPRPGDFPHTETGPPCA